MLSKVVRYLSVLAILVIALGFAPSAQAADLNAVCNARVNNTFDKLLKCVTVEGLREHQAALQEIANQNNGIRTSGTPGFDASAAYAADVFRAAGYQVRVQSFDFQTFISLSPSILQVISPLSMVVENHIFSYSGSGDVTAAIYPLQAALGCAATDFAGFPVGKIALISRGSCTFAIKAANAYAAGASGVIIYNNQDGVINGTLGNDFTLNIPVTSITQQAGQDLLSLTPGLTVHLMTSTYRGTATTSNVLAESVYGNADNVVMVGAHLDSVDAGPGINDNGSGAAAILEVAQQMAKVKPVNKVRFALWGAEEANLVGSTYYVNGLSTTDRNKITLYLNFDMIGSPNGVFFIYDGDDSDKVGAGAGPSGSAQIEKTFQRYYQSAGMPYKGTDFTGRSDYGPFIANNIPSGGIFTGAEGIKTAVEASVWGGTAGLPYDVCYHQSCDTIDNVNLAMLGVNVDAVAYGTLQYAMNTSDVNKVKGKGNFKFKQVDDPNALVTQ